jgi:hypothetical protein
MGNRRTRHVGGEFKLTTAPKSLTNAAELASLQICLDELGSLGGITELELDGRDPSEQCYLIMEALRAMHCILSGLLVALGTSGP